MRVVIAEGHCRSPLSDLHQAIGIIESIIYYGLTRHRQAGPSASIVIRVAHGTLWRGVGSQPIQVVKTSRHRPRDGVHDLPKPIPGVVGRVIDRAFIRRSGCPAVPSEGHSVQPIVAELRHLAAPVRELDQVAVAVVAVRLAYSPRESSIALLVQQGVFAGLNSVHVVVRVLRLAVVCVHYGQQIPIRVVAERGLLAQRVRYV